MGGEVGVIDDDGAELHSISVSNRLHVDDLDRFHTSNQFQMGICPVSLLSFATDLAR